MPAGYFFVLASGSPRRREFMQLLGLPFQVITPASAGHPIDETPLPGESPAALVQRLSRIKAEVVAKTWSIWSGLKPDLLPDDTPFIIIAADTIVVLEDKILGKPQNPAEAVFMLKQLREREHAVYSGLTVAAVERSADFNPRGLRPGLKHLHLPQVQVSGLHYELITRLHQSAVWMRPYTDAEIEVYVASGDPLDKAGAYGIQNKAFAPVARLEGCFASVMGFPLGELAAALRELDILLPDIGLLCAGYTGQMCCQQMLNVQRSSSLFLKTNRNGVPKKPYFSRRRFSR